MAEAPLTRRYSMRFTPKSLAESLESTADPAFAVDAEGKITAWNSAAKTALGCSRRNALGEFCFNVIGGKDVLGNQVCKRKCLVFRSLRKREPVRRFRMHVRAGTGHLVEAECTTLCLLSSTREASIIHLLRLCPGRGRDRVSHPRHGDTPGLQRAAHPLTPREMEVLRLLAKGRSTRQIAEDLYVSPATVRTHVEHVFGKLNAHSRLEAVVIGAREGLL
jgi:DNA-binding CsgD family transcriptional regulator